MSPLLQKNSPSPSLGNLDLVKWVIVELTPIGEKEENISNIIHSVHKILNDHDLEVFVPAISQKDVGQYNQTLFYMDGYIFIRFKPGVSYFKLRETQYFKEVLCTKRSKRREPRYSLLDNNEIDKLRAGMQQFKRREFEIDDEIKIKKGTYKNLKGIVSQVYDTMETVQVAVNLRSKRILIDFPATYIERVKPDKS